MDPNTPTKDMTTRQLLDEIKRLATQLKTSADDMSYTCQLCSLQLIAADAAQLIERLKNQPDPTPAR